MSRIEKRLLVDMPRIVAIVVLLALGITFLCAAITMAITGIELGMISISIEDIEHTALISPAGWGDSAIKKYNDQQSLRAELQNSTNPIVSVFANSSNFLRFIEIVASLIFFALFTFSAMMLFMFHCAKKKHQHCKTNVPPPKPKESPSEMIARFETYRIL